RSPRNSRKKRLSGWSSGSSSKPGMSKWNENGPPRSDVASTLAWTRTLTTAGETFSTTSAKPVACTPSTRTASASTGAVPVVTAPSPIAPAMASEAAAAIRRLRVFDWELVWFCMSLGSFVKRRDVRMVTSFGTRDREANLTVPLPPDETFVIFVRQPRDASLGAVENILQPRLLLRAQRGGARLRRPATAARGLDQQEAAAHGEQQGRRRPQQGVAQAESRLEQ